MQKRAEVSEPMQNYGVLMPEPKTDRYLSPNEIGKILHVTGEAVKQWIYQRRLPAVKLANGYWKVKVSDFEAFMKARNDVGRRRILITGTSDMAGVHQAIERLGHQTITAHNYADALLKATDHYPALIVINLASEESDPWKLAQKVRATKALRNIPILLIASNEPNENDADMALDILAQGFLKRPLEVDLLASEIDRILNRTL